jgi:gliding motility-associated-like protein
MKFYPTVKLIPLLLLSLIAHNLAKAQIISNGSFEGTPQQDNPPEDWHSCNEFSTPDTQPGSWEVRKAASDGNSYLGLVTRGNLGPYANHTEAAGTQLLKPLLKDKAYDFKLDLAFSESWGHFIDFGSTFLKYDTPARLRIYGGSSACDKLELLWESPVVDHHEWQAYSFTLLPLVQDVHYLILEVAYSTNHHAFGNILIDNMAECSIDLEIASEIMICENEPFTVDATIPNGKYVWQDGSTDPVFSISSAGSYHVEVSNQCSSKRYEIAVSSRNCLCDTAVPIEVTAFDSLICENETIVLDVLTPGGFYVWENGSVEPGREVNQEGNFSVEVSNGCETEYLEFNIGLRDCNCEIVAPNVFTPNGDYMNEFFEIKGSTDIGRFHLQIFNRWGTLVYQSDDITKAWDGTTNGQNVPAGVYYWTADLMCIQGNAITDNSFKGYVTVLR